MHVNVYTLQYNFVKETIGYSAHPQMMVADALPDSLRIAAKSPDGVVEVVEFKDHPFAIGTLAHHELAIDRTVALTLVQEMKRYVLARHSLQQPISYLEFLDTYPPKSGAGRY